MQAKRFRKRDAILAFLRESQAHPSAEAVYAGLKQQMPDISLGTVYRNLSLFKQQGLVRSLGSVNGVERFDGHIDPHVHFICECCGSVQDLHQMQIPGDLAQAAAAFSCGEVEQCQLTFYGRCTSCNHSNPKSEKSTS